MPTNEHSPGLGDVFQDLPDGLVMQTLEGTILAANPAFARMFGINLETVRGKKIFDLLPAQLREQWQLHIRKLIDGEWTQAEGLAISQTSGRQIPIQINLITRTRQAGQEAIMLQLRDMAVFQTMQHALVDAEEQWERSFDAITDYLCLLDRHGRILRVNRAMIEKFQPTHGPLLGRNYEEVLGTLQRPGMLQPSDIAKEAPCIFEEITLPHIKGYFYVSVFPLKNEKRALTGFILIVKDITEAYELRAALKKSESGMYHASKMEAIGRLAGGIAHDFNNMLTSILGYTSLMLRSMTESAPLRKDLQEIVRAAERATALTRQLLDLSHEPQLDLKVISINEVIENMAHFLRHTLGNDIQLSLRLGKQLHQIQADTSRLEQILVNLAINARDAMPEGGQLVIETANIELDKNFCALHRGSRPGHYVLIEVSDSGHGMSPEVLEHIFEPFYTTKAKGKGTGLGLATIYAHVRQMNGCIFCYSEIEKGSTFKIYLPQAQQGAPRETPRPKTTLPCGQETILVVDDDPNIINLISEILKGLGYQVLRASCGAEALRISQEHAGGIDLLLADIIMPGLRGTDLGRELIRKRPGLKVLYMSGYADGIARHTTTLRANDLYLQKPFSLEKLAVCVRRALDQPCGPTDPVSQPPISSS